MAVVVEQTIPFTPQSLDLGNAERWTKLLPLIRPSLRRHPLAHGHTLLLDTAELQQDTVHVVAVSSSGTFSSKLLSDSSLAGIVVEQQGKSAVAADEVAKEFGSQSKLVIVRSGRQRMVETKADGILQVEAEGDLEFDHLLSLLASIQPSTRSSLDQVAELVKAFVKATTTAHSTFHTDLFDGNPAILHGDESNAYEKAKHAVQRDLTRVLRPQSSQTGSVTYSVHYADVNGLSRLEHYILGMEIAKFLESQSLPYSLSSSTLVQHDKPARGFAISVCPVPESFLVAQPSPSAPLNDEASTSSSTSETKESSKINFDDATVRARIEAACNAVIAAEPTITRYDETVGDGDCGYTLRDGAKQVLAFTADKDLALLPQTLASLVNHLEVTMGGTSGALYCIFLTAFAGALTTEPTVAAALDAALQQLLKYTRARLGDRTMLDCLIPFVDVLVKKGDAKLALKAAAEGVDQTKDLKASLGRSTYLDESATKGVPDPGAYGLLVLLEGMCK